MTEPESSREIPASDQPGEASATLARADEAPESEPEPAPEPWTAERVSEWNAYYDLYVVLGVLLLIFIASASKITHPSIWTQLRAGQVQSEQGAPLVRDAFSYTEEGKRWDNIPWVFEWVSYQLYHLGSSLTPRDPSDPGASAALAEQVGAGTLVAICALIRVATALMLLAIRRPGPGLWWTAVCVTLALGTVFSPVGVVLGGIAAPGQVAPGTWGLFLLALEMLLLHRAINLGYRRALYGLVPVFLLWANVDDSFLIGLLILAAGVIGLLERPAPSESGERAQGVPEGDAPPALAPPTLGKGLLVLAACVAVCLANPSFHHVFRAAFSPFMTIFQPKGEIRTIDQVSFFGSEIQDKGDVWIYMTAYYLIVTAVGLGSFVLNLKRFSLSRFLMYAVAAGLWAFMIRYGAEFAVVFAATLSLNGQEWYQDRFGRVGRLGRGWALWSVGGRAVSIVLVFLCIARALTGWGSFYGDLQFGFGFNPDEFEFEAADYLRTAPIKGKVLNTTRHQGDALVWRGYPHRKTYIDNRHNLFDAEFLHEWMKIRNALKVDEIESWKPLLDKYGITAVMLDVPSAPLTYQRLMQSVNWIPFYDDGNVVMFGRADAPAADLAYFKAQRLDADTLVYRRVKPVPTAERPPTQVTWIDSIFQSRSLARRQPHGIAASRWLQVPGFESGTPGIPDPAHCLLAVREARAALAAKPDDTFAYRILVDAYRFLMIQETALLQGIRPTPENMNVLSQIVAQPALLMNRHRQRVTALNFAIQSTPPPQSQADRRALQGLNLELFQLYLSVSHLDLARDRLKDAIDKAGADDFKPEAKAQLTEQLNQLNEQIKQVQDRMSDLTIEQQATPVERAYFAINNGAPGIAIQELEDADRTNLSPKVVKPQLIDLYCDTGQPDKAQELMGLESANDTSLGSEPGTAALRRGRVYFLLGNYEEAAALWQRIAIPQLRFDRSYRALLETQALIKGEARTATSTLVSIPEKIATQASWEFDLGLCRLESGIPDAAPPEHPDGAAEHFTKALTLLPDFTDRPIIAYYLEMMGRPVPPSSQDKAKPAAAKPAEPKK